MSDGLDPEIAALLANSGGGDSAEAAPGEDADVMTLDSPSAMDSKGTASSKVLR